MPRVAALLLVFATAVFAQSDSTIPKLVTEAQFVHVTTLEGDPNSPNTLAEDRRAIADVETALRKWRRYKVVLQPGDADLIMVVRTGRIASATVGGTAGNRNPRRVPRVTGPNIHTEAGGPRQDLLWVFDAKLGTDSAPLWRGEQRDGLEAPSLPLLKRFRADVERSSGKP